jgi:hypothetical protein
MMVAMGFFGNKEDLGLEGSGTVLQVGPDVTDIDILEYNAQDVIQDECGVRKSYLEIEPNVVHLDLNLSLTQLIGRLFLSPVKSMTS